jgi:hypothetical protein
LLASGEEKAKVPRLDYEAFLGVLLLFGLVVPEEGDIVAGDIRAGDG